MLCYQKIDSLSSTVTCDSNQLRTVASMSNECDSLCKGYYDPPYQMRLRLSNMSKAILPASSAMKTSENTFRMAVSVEWHDL